MPAPRSRTASAALLAVAAALSASVLPSVVRAVETDVAVSTTSVDFGEVDVGATASVSVTLTNTGADPFGPINMFGGAPPSAEFNASQNCQANTLPAGGSCRVEYSFSPGATGTFDDTSSFTVSETTNQSDGEDFTISLTGVGVDPAASTTTSSTTSSTDAPTTTSTTPSDSSPSPTSPSTPSSSGADGPTASTASASTTTTTSLPALPLTGVAVPRPALVVKVDNVDAEPQAGLNQADIVFEEIVEGSATRFAAVYHSVDAPVVGPVRSARVTDVDLALGLGDPAIVISGANDGVLAALAAADLEVVGEGAPGFARRDDLPAPHNLFVDLRSVWPALTSSGDAVALFDHQPTGSTADGEAVSFAELRVGAYDVRWDWDPAAGLFLRSQLGRPHDLVDGRASTVNVVVLVVDYTVTPDGSPQAHTVGDGEAVVYRDGARHDATWSRPSPTSPFALTADSGEPVLLMPGRTWVELVSSEHGLTDG